MIKLYKYLVFAAQLCFIGMPLTSCGDDEDEPTPAPPVVSLSVNPNSISLVSDRGAAATFAIECSGQWHVSEVPQWLNLSAVSGVGNTSVTVTTLSENATASIRSCTLLVTSDEVSASVEVSQLGSLQSGCEVTVSDKVVLNDSYAIRLKFGPKAEFFYAGYLSASSAGWTDDRIIQAIDDGNAVTAEDGYVITAGDLFEDTNYIQCVVAYDAQGNRGEVLKFPVTTMSSRNAPTAPISNIQYDSSKWTWETTIGPFANDYYMIAFQGLEAWIAYVSTNAEIGLYLKDNVNELSSYVQSGKWRMTRTDPEICIYTWARRNEEWSSVINRSFYDISSGKVASRVAGQEQTPKLRFRSPSEQEQLKNAMTELPF